MWTEDADEAAVRFDLFIQAKEHKGWSDLAKGAGGSFRYLRAVQDENNADKITELKLHRSAASPVKDFGDWDGHTGDINQGRALSYLYFMWKNHTAW